MRVLHVIEATIGGTRRHIVDVAGGLARSGVDTWLVSSTLRDPPYARDLAELERLGVRRLDLPMVRPVRPAQDARHLQALEGILRRVRPDVIHTHCSKAGTLGRLASLCTGIGARVHTPHTLAFLQHEMHGGLARKLYLELERGLFAHTARLIAVSDSEAESFVRAGLGDPARLRVVPNGVDTQRWSDPVPCSRSTLGIPESASMTVVAGLLNVAKGQDLAVRALAELGLESAHLVLAGHGEMRAELEQLAAELGVSERVHLLGWRDDVPALFAASDLVLVPSRWEAMPYAALEAMAVGRALVATRVDGARELVRDGVDGALIPTEDVPALARAWRSLLLLSPAERAALGRAGRERVLGRFSIENMLHGLRQVYSEVA